jgi:hypothetical protein
MQIANFFHHQCGLFSSTFNFVSKRVDAPGKEPIIPAQGGQCTDKKENQIFLMYKEIQLQSHI